MTETERMMNRARERMAERDFERAREAYERRERSLRDLLSRVRSECLWRREYLRITRGRA